MRNSIGLTRFGGKGMGRERERELGYVVIAKQVTQATDYSSFGITLVNRQT